MGWFVSRKYNSCPIQKCRSQWFAFHRVVLGCRVTRCQWPDCRCLLVDSVIQQAAIPKSSRCGRASASMSTLPGFRSRWIPVVRARVTASHSARNTFSRACSEATAVRTTASASGLRCHGHEWPPISLIPPSIRRDAGMIQRRQEASFGLQQPRGSHCPRAAARAAVCWTHGSCGGPDKPRPCRTTEQTFDPPIGDRCLMAATVREHASAQGVQPGSSGPVDALAAHKAVLPLARRHQSSGLDQHRVLFNRRIQQARKALLNTPPFGLDNWLTSSLGKSCRCRDRA